MKTLAALALLPLLWATRTAADTMPPECAEVVIPASASPHEAAALMSACAAALRAEPRRPLLARAPPPPQAQGRPFAALRELGELRPRSVFQAASLEPAATGDVSAPRCALASPAAAPAQGETCLGCHPRHGHPVDLPYAASRARAPGSLRVEAEVVRRGVLLPEGRVACVTCHDAASPWKHRIALPPGAPAVAAVVPGRAETYPRASWRLARANAGPRLPPGSAVSPAPLCAACHTYAD